MIAAFSRDLRYAIRTLFRNPGVTCVVVLTMAIGIGANSAMFSIVNAFLLRPFAFQESSRLFAVWYGKGSRHQTTAYPTFTEWRKENHVFSDLVAEYTTRYSLSGVNDPREIVVRQVSARYFDMFGVSPIRGRTFLPGEHQSGADPVALLTTDLWTSDYGRDPSVLGRTVLLNGTAYTIVGIMGRNAPEFNPASPAQIWLPLERNAPMASMMRGYNFINQIGRLKPGISIDRAINELEAMNLRVNPEHADLHIATRMQPLQEYLFGWIRGGLLALLGAVAFVLLIACANISNVLVARASVRVKEFAIRTSLGARGGRIVSQMLTESLVLALAGGLAGLVLAAWLDSLALRWWPGNVTRPAELPLDWRVLLFTLFVSIVAGLLFGLGPAALMRRSALTECLKDGGHACTCRKSNRLLQVIVVSEMVFVTMLLVGTGLMLRSFANMLQASPGFDPRLVLTARVRVPESKASEQWKICREILSRLKNLPGVVSAGAINDLPLGEHVAIAFDVEGKPVSPDKQQYAVFQKITEGYFQTMRIPLLSGRFFTDQEIAARREIVIINQRFARRYWPGEDAVGKRISSSRGWREIVGVVGDVKLNGIDQDSWLEIYAPYTLGYSNLMTMVLRTSGDPFGLVPSIRNEIRAVDREQVAPVVAMDGVLHDSFGRRRMVTLLLASFAGIALLLACVGIYGVMSYWVTQRTREIGTRLAVGAVPGDIVGMVTVEGIRLTGLGIAIGTAAALTLGRFLESFLFGVGSADFAALAVASLVLAVVSLLGSAIPAYRATKISAAVALRYE